MILSGPGDVVCTDSDIWSYLYPFMNKYKDRKALICKKTGVEYTYQDTIERTLRWANVLEQYFPCGNPKVVIFASNIADYFILMNGIFAVGGSVCTLNNKYAEELVAFILKDLKPDAIVVEKYLLPIIENVTASLQINPKTFVIGEEQADNLNAILNSSHVPSHINRKVNPDSTAFIFYSSGTTGTPKGIAHTHKAFVTQCKVYSELPYYQYYRKDGVQEFHPTSFTCAHVAGCRCFYFIPTTFGDCVITLDFWDSEKIIETIKEYKIQSVLLRPFEIGKLACLENVENILGSVKMISSVGTFPDTQAQVDLHKRIPHIKFVEAYGLTESPTLAVTPGNGDVPAKGMIPMSGVTIQIRNIATNEVLGPMTKGIVMAKSVWLMKEYVNKPKETEAAFKDGWLITGDMGYFTKDSKLFLIGRASDVIFVDGTEIMPSVIEQRICEHPSVSAAAVIGSPSVEKGQIPKAFVILKTNNVSEIDIQEFANKRAEDDGEKLTAVRFVKSMPRNPMGKILKKELRRFDWNEVHASTMVSK